MDKKRAEDLGHFVRRLETLDAEIGDLKQDVKEVMTEAKQAGFNLKALRRILALRKMSEEDRAAMQDLVDEYGEALGMWANTPLGQAAADAGDDPDDDPDGDDDPDPDDAGDNVTRLH